MWKEGEEGMKPERWFMVTGRCKMVTSFPRQVFQQNSHYHGYCQLIKMQKCQSRLHSTCNLENLVDSCSTYRILSRNIHFKSLSNDLLRKQMLITDKWPTQGHTRKDYNDLHSQILELSIYSKFTIPSFLPQV